MYTEEHKINSKSLMRKEVQWNPSNSKYSLSRIFIAIKMVLTISLCKFFPVSGISISRKFLKLELRFSSTRGITVSVSRIFGAKKYCDLIQIYWSVSRQQNRHVFSCLADVAHTIYKILSDMVNSKQQWNKKDLWWHMGQWGTEMATKQHSKCQTQKLKFIAKIEKKGEQKKIHYTTV